MTIAQLIEILCTLVEELTELVDQLSMRLLQAGSMTEGEFSQVQEILKRVDAIGISPPSNEKVINQKGVGH